MGLEQIIFIFNALFLINLYVFIRIFKNIPKKTSENN